MTQGTVECPSCGRVVPWNEVDWDSANQRCRACAGLPPKSVGSEAPATRDISGAGTGAARSDAGVSVFLTLLGLALIGIGLYYLVLHPSNPSEFGGDSGTVTIHRLVIGQTATLAGVIFCAVAWRPR
jgi:hypothetical protein